MRYRRMPIEIESPEQMGYGNIRFNLAESSVADQGFRDLPLELGHLVFAYGDHLGKPELRELIAAEANGIRPEPNGIRPGPNGIRPGPNGIRPDQVILTVGAAAALFIVNTVLLKPGDHMIVAFPNYATNIETPRAIGVDVGFLPLVFEQGWRVDLLALERMLRPETKLISVTTPHNPTGMMLTEQDLRAVIALAERVGCHVLVDETYREMAFAASPPLAAGLSPRVISVSSLSKSYGLPGIRLGWVVCQDPVLFEQFLAAKEQIFISTSLVDEEIAFQALRQKAGFLGRLRGLLEANFLETKTWMAAQDGFEWVEPQGGAVGFVRIHPSINLDVERFYRVLNADFGTFVGPGHWFECDRRYFRLGYGWPKLEELRGGLNALSSALERVRFS